VAEARDLVEQYRLEHNHRRPHSALGYRTPAEFVAELATGPSASASAPDGAPAFDHPPVEGEVVASLS